MLICSLTARRSSSPPRLVETMVSHSAYWPWWMGSLALAAVTLGYLVTQGRGLGVSGLYARLFDWRRESEAGRLERDEALRAALIEATRRRFGDAALELESDSSDPPPLERPVSPGVGLLFLVCLLLGGKLAASLHEAPALGPTLGVEFERLLGRGASGTVVLFLGGLLVGFGTRMASGCTSGHGLSGCSRLHPASLVATLSFFATAVVASLLLSSWLG